MPTSSRSFGQPPPPPSKCAVSPRATSLTAIRTGLGRKSVSFEEDGAKHGMRLAASLPASARGSCDTLHSLIAKDEPESPALMPQAMQRLTHSPSTDPPLVGRSRRRRSLDPEGLASRRRAVSNPPNRSALAPQHRVALSSPSTPRQARQTAPIRRQTHMSEEEAEALRFAMQSPPSEHDASRATSTDQADSELGAHPVDRIPSEDDSGGDIIYLPRPPPAGSSGQRTDAARRRPSRRLVSTRPSENTTASPEAGQPAPPQDGLGNSSPTAHSAAAPQTQADRGHSAEEEAELLAGIQDAGAVAAHVLAKCDAFEQGRHALWAESLAEHTAVPLVDSGTSALYVRELDSAFSR